MKHCALALIVALSTQGAAQAESKRGFQSKKDFRFGPVFQSGLSLGHTGDRQYYSLSLQGESPEKGFSRIFARGVGLYELLELKENLNAEDSKTTTIRFHHQFLTLGIESPVLYDFTRPYSLELGWRGGFTLARVTFKEPSKSNTDIWSTFADYKEIPPTTLAKQRTTSAQSDTQFLGGELGSYLRYYRLYPFVFYASGAVSYGGFFDPQAFIEGIDETPDDEQDTKTRLFQSASIPGLEASVGLDIHLFDRGIVGVNYTLWNWNWYRSTDYTHFLGLRAGFLF